MTTNNEPAPHTAAPQENIQKTATAVAEAIDRALEYWGKDNVDEPRSKLAALSKALNQGGK